MQFDWNEFIRALPREEQLICKRLRQLVLETEPRLIEKSEWGVPYYRRNRLVCFIWPVSAPNAPTAKNQKYDGTLVSLGFNYGNQLSNVQGLLRAEGRKQVYIIRLRSFKELTALESPIIEIIQEAVLLDEQKQLRKPKAKSKV